MRWRSGCGPLLGWAGRRLLLFAVLVVVAEGGGDVALGLVGEHAGWEVRQLVGEIIGETSRQAAEVAEGAGALALGVTGLAGGVVALATAGELGRAARVAAAGRALLLVALLAGRLGRGALRRAQAGHRGHTRDAAATSGLHLLLALEEV